MVRNYHGDAEWIPGTVLKKFGPVTYSVDKGDGRTVKLHIDQLRQNVHYSTESTSNPIDDYYYSHEPVAPLQCRSSSANSSKTVRGRTMLPSATALSPR